MANKPAQRRMDNVDLRLGVYFLAIPILLLYGIALTSCLSGLPNVYVLQLKGPKQVLRVGYFGLCAHSTANNNFHCLSSASSSLSTLAERFDLPTKQLPLLQTALTLQRRILIPLLIPAGIFFFLSLLPLTLLKRNLKKSSVTKPQHLIRSIALGLTWLSVAMVLVAAVSVQMSTGALHFLAEERLKIGVEGGVVLQALQWVIVSLEVVYAVGVTSIFSVRDGTVRSAGYESKV